MSYALSRVRRRRDRRDEHPGGDDARDAGGPSNGSIRRPRRLLVDGNRCPELPCPARAVVRGDALVPAISAASILAKVERDREMMEMDHRYPEYGFARHKGYGTRAHRHALLAFGPSPIHRRSFAPVKLALARCARHRGPS